MWKCKKCGEIDNFIGHYRVSTTSFDWDGDPDIFDFKVEDIDEVCCQKCGAEGGKLNNIADYIERNSHA